MLLLLDGVQLLDVLLKMLNGTNVLAVPASDVLAVLALGNPVFHSLEPVAILVIIVLDFEEIVLKLVDEVVATSVLNLWLLCSSRCGLKC